MSGGRRTTMRVALVVVAALVSIATLAGLGVLAFGLAGSRVVADTFALPADMRTLTIDTGNVPVAVRLTTDDNAEEARLALRMVTRAEGPPLTVVNDATSSRVTLAGGGSEFPWFDGTGEIAVVLPPDAARRLSVTVDHRAGPLTVQADLDQLVATTDGGTVWLGGSARRIDIDVRHGDIRTSTRVAVSESFSAAVESGSVSVEFRAPPRMTEVIADGNVTVGLPGTEPYRVRARTGQPNGETRVTVPQTTDPDAPEVTARSERGHVHIDEIR